MAMDDAIKDHIRTFMRHGGCHVLCNWLGRMAAMTVILAIVCCVAVLVVVACLLLVVMGVMCMTAAALYLAGWLYIDDGEDGEMVIVVVGYTLWLGVVAIVMMLCGSCVVNFGPMWIAGMDRWLARVAPDAGVHELVAAGEEEESGGGGDADDDESGEFVDGP
jgi:hypothetical protein